MPDKKTSQSAKRRKRVHARYRPVDFVHEEIDNIREGTWSRKPNRHRHCLSGPAVPGLIEPPKKGMFSETTRRIALRDTEKGSKEGPVFRPTRSHSRVGPAKREYGSLLLLPKSIVPGRRVRRPGTQRSGSFPSPGRQWRRVRGNVRRRRKRHSD